MFKIWNHIQARVEEVKEADGETIRHYFDDVNFVLSNGVELRDLRDGRFIEDDETPWTEAFQEDDGEFVHVGLFYRL